MVHVPRGTRVFQLEGMFHVEQMLRILITSKTISHLQLLQREKSPPDDPLKQARGRHVPTLTNLILSVPILDENWHFDSRAVTNLMTSMSWFPTPPLAHIRASRRATPYLACRNGDLTPLLPSWYRSAALWNCHSESPKAPAIERLQADSWPSRSAKSQSAGRASRREIPT
jgi:hypothetical protein